MKKILLALAFCLAGALPSHAQYIPPQIQVPCSSIVVFPVIAGAPITDFFLNLNCNVTSSVITGSLQPGMEVAITITQSAGGNTFVWPAAFTASSIPTLPTGAGATVASTWQYCGFVGLGLACPSGGWQNTDVGPANVPAAGGNVIYASSFGVKANGKNNCYANITNTSNQVTLVTGFGGTAFSASDQGSRFFATNAPCGGNGASATPSAVIITGFICASGGFVNASTVNICTTSSGSTPANATATCTSNHGTTASCPANWWANDDTAALQSAFNQVLLDGVCGELVLPAGRIPVSAPINGTTNTCPNIATNQSTTTMGYTVIGQGPSSSVLVIDPLFNAATCGSPQNQCFFGVPPGNAPTAVYFAEFGIDGGGNGTVTNGAGKNIFTLIGPGGARNLSVSQWGQNTATFTAYNMSSNAGGDAIRADNLYAFNGASTCFQTIGLAQIVGGACVNPFGSIFNGNGSGCANTYGVDFNAQDTTAQGGVVELLNTAQDDCWNDYGSRMVNTGAGPEIMCGGKCYLFGSRPAGQGNANQIALYLQDTGAHAGTAWASGSTFKNTATVAIGGGVAGSTFFDLGGNTVIGTITTTNISFFGSGSITGTSLVVGNVGLTSGWGTSTVATASGDSHAGRFTITGAAGAASPTLTLTFPTAYFVAPSSCQLIETGANDFASLSNPVSATASTTSVVFTLTGTPVAVTYQFDYRCGP